MDYPIWEIYIVIQIKIMYIFHIPWTKYIIPLEAKLISPFRSIAKNLIELQLCVEVLMGSVGIHKGST